MFLLGVRDGFALRLLFGLTAIQSLVLIAVFYANFLGTLFLVIFSLIASVLFSGVLVKNREVIQFNKKFAKNLAFPSSGKLSRSNFVLHTAIILLCFIPSAFILLAKPSSLAEAELRFVVSTFFLFGHLGIVGLAVQGLIKMEGNR